MTVDLGNKLAAATFLLTLVYLLHWDESKLRIGSDDPNAQ